MYSTSTKSCIHNCPKMTSAQRQRLDIVHAIPSSSSWTDQRPPSKSFGELQHNDQGEEEKFDDQQTSSSHACHPPVSGKRGARPFVDDNIFRTQLTTLLRLRMTKDPKTQLSISACHPHSWKEPNRNLRMTRIMRHWLHGGVWIACFDNMKTIGWDRIDPNPMFFWKSCAVITHSVEEWEFHIATTPFLCTVHNLGRLPVEK